MAETTTPVPRLVARAIDETVVVAIQVAFVVPAVFLTSMNQLSSDNGREEIAVVSFCLVFAGWFVSGFYEVASTHLGGSPGKRIMGLRVLAADPDEPDGNDSTRTGTAGTLTVGRSVGRALLVSGAQPLLWCVIGLPGDEVEPGHIVLMVLIAGTVLWRGLLALSVVRSGGRSSIHDRMVGSRVVQVEARPIPGAGADVAIESVRR
jgi:uncharacterized RDD family membrane protein YckC